MHAVRLLDACQELKHCRAGGSEHSQHQQRSGDLRNRSADAFEHGSRLSADRLRSGGAARPEDGRRADERRHLHAAQPHRRSPIHRDHASSRIPTWSKRCNSFAISPARASTSPRGREGRSIAQRLGTAVSSSTSGRTPKAEIMHIRIEHAKMLLAQTDKSERPDRPPLRLPSLVYFTKAFRREVGMTPRTYRRMRWMSRGS